jgi:tRNA-binding EMAP/Myf-like protein
MKKENHQANVVRVTEIKTHNNADNLEIIPIGEYQVVSRKGQFKVGELAIYIQPDSVVPQTEPFKFIWQPYLDSIQNTPSFTTYDDGLPSIDEKVPEKKRRITVRKFRQEWSEGLLLSVGDFGFVQTQNGYISLLETYYFKEGDDVSDFLKITHYDPDTESTKGENTAAPKAKKKGYPRSIRGWINYIRRHIMQWLGFEAKTDGKAESVSLGIPVYDVHAYKAKPSTFVEGELVQISEKIHGSNARYLFHDGKMYAGSRNLWKAENSNCIFRRALKELPWIEDWCRAHEGHVLWGEVTPTKKGYEYGSKNVQFFVFDIYKPNRTWADDSDDVALWLGIKQHVPVFYTGEYKGYEHVKQFVDGPSTVPGAKNIREGVVVVTLTERHERSGSRAQRKVVSNVFLERDNK